MQRTISPLELQQLIETDGHGIDVIDVRKSYDYEADPVVIPGAQHRSPENVSDWLSDMAVDRQIVVYCVHGHAVSNGVLDQLLAAGYRARLIDGGIEAWRQSGGPTVAG
ncbi:MAG: thiosulfate sulfurtransferase GlpE [Gammaproteobacteria bacterium]|nr:thiosulfate sulfurtransferase GlpE [Gammaproteobacteria bacterium]